MKLIKVTYSYLPQQFNNCTDLWLNLKKFVATSDFTLGQPLYEFEKIFARLMKVKYAVELKKIKSKRNAKYSKFHIGNFAEERFKDIFKSQRYWRIRDYLASPNFDAQTMIGTLPIQRYVSEALDNHLKGHKITQNNRAKPLHVNFV